MIFPLYGESASALGLTADHLRLSFCTRRKFPDWLIFYRPLLSSDPSGNGVPTKQSNKYTDIWETCLLFIQGRRNGFGIVFFISHLHIKGIQFSSFVYLWFQNSLSYQSILSLFIYAYLYLTIFKRQNVGGIAPPPAPLFLRSCHHLSVLKWISTDTDKIALNIFETPLILIWKQ